MEIHTIPLRGHALGGRYLVFRPLLGLAFVGNRAMARLARRVVAPTAQGEGRRDGEAEAFLRGIGFLEPDPPPPPAGPASPRPTTAVLLLTNRCQLRCRYCYASGGDGPIRELPESLARVAIDQVCRAARETGASAFEVSFHGGGEPTRCWNRLCSLAAYARSRDWPVRLSLTSNGVWSPSQCGWIVEHLHHVSLSIDGAPEVQDRQRPLASGAGSSAVVMRSVRELDRHGFPYGIRLTAQPPWNGLAGNVRYLCEHSACRVFQVEPAFNPRRGHHGEGSTSAVRAFAQAFLQAMDVAAAHGRVLQYSGARLGVVTHRFCRAADSALIVGADGRLTACYEVTGSDHPLAEVSTLGTVSRSGVWMDAQAAGRLEALLEGRRSRCTRCPAYRSCAGDCYVRTFGSEPGGHLRFGSRCTLNRLLLRQLLLRGIAAGRGVWRSRSRSRSRLPSREPSHVA